jgi:putative ABC transport system substrate-binding protein
VTVLKKVLITILLLIFFPSPSLAGGEILVVQSVRIPPYEKAIEGFLSVSNPKIKRFVISELKTPDLAKKVKKIDPHLILTIGRDALVSVKQIRDIPVVYIMVLFPQSILTHDDNFYGISMNISPERQLEVFIKSIPGLNNIGLIYNPDNTGELVRKTVEAAEKSGIRLITEKAQKAGVVPSMIKEMADKIEAFWMLPDITIMTPETIEFLLITSMEMRIPILTFSIKYLEMGALISVAVDPYDMGKQAGEIAQKLLAGEVKGDEKRIFARRGIISINTKIAEKLGIDLNSEPNTDIMINK